MCPFSTTARRSRKERLHCRTRQRERVDSLVAVTALWIAIAYLKLTPAHISFLDIDFGEARVRPSILVALVGLYLWLSFLVYGFRDAIVWYRTATANIAGGYSQLKQRRASNDAAQAAFDKGVAENLPPTERANVAWPEYQQESTLEDIQRGLPNWRSHEPQVLRELILTTIDSVLRSLWEFVLPFGCGVALVVWLLFGHH
jgi:hypothetical protein